MRSLSKLSVAVTLLVAMLAGCEGGKVEVETSSSERRIIYGPDDRLEAYQVDPLDATAQKLFASEVALFHLSEGLLTESALDGYDIASTPTFADWANNQLCSTEPYADQPNPAFCSGFIVGEDLIATAGHCVSRKDCGDVAFVFGFHMEAEGVPVTWVPEDNVYFCASIVGDVVRRNEDWAIVKVDRAIVGREPLPLRRSGAVPVDTPLVVIGHPTGLPTKLAGNATVQEALDPAYFSANLDTYGGNSGSAVVSLDASGALSFVEGILVRGNPDFVEGTDPLTGDACYTSNTCPDTGCGPDDEGEGWEEVTRSTVFADKVPLPPVCGDGSCDPGEDCVGCGADCGQCVVCAPKDAPCANNADCCSDRCHPKTKLCK